MKRIKTKVFVGMSGGVDSSVSAALLKQQGFDVTGVFIKTWHPDWLPCTWKEERRDAMRAAAVIGIPLITLDLSNEYKRGVVDYMLAEYSRGRTPNPDVMCNKEIKFGSFLRAALQMGAEFIATGHYAQVKKVGETLHLYEGVDKKKDQSYFLWTLRQQELSHTIFPVGHLEKSEVRVLAKKFKLPVADKKDSQGICFLGEVDMKEFLSHYIITKTGAVLNELGEKIGIHNGAIFYTIGERHGFVITEKSPTDSPYYVISKDVIANTITVSPVLANVEIGIRSTKIGNTSWVWQKAEQGDVLGVRIRYRQEKQGCEIGAKGEITFVDSQIGVSAGQSLVFYRGEECLGGGIIEPLV